MGPALTLAICLVGIGVVLVSIMVWFKPNPQEPVKCCRSGPELSPSIQLKLISEALVRNQLAVPATAMFNDLPGSPSGVSFETNGMTAVVKGWVDSQNTFGAMERMEWMVLYTNYNGDLWPIFGSVGDLPLVWDPPAP